MTFLSHSLLLIALGARVALAQALTLDQLVTQAMNRARERETARVSAAIANQSFLESQSKLRFELRPRMSMLAFSNPALLAGSLGFSMLLGQNRPSPWTLQNARLDTFAAEVGAKRAIILAEREAVRLYFGLLQRQNAAEQLLELVGQRRATLRSVDERVKAAMATAIDSAVLETGLIALETQLEDAEIQRRIAASALREVLGMHEGEELRVASLEIPEVQEIPPTTVLYNSAMRERDPTVTLRLKLEAERERVYRERPLSASLPSVSYAHISDGSLSGVGLGQGFLLGGNTGTIDTGLKISLRTGAENAALAKVAAARIRALELELADLDDSVRSHLDDLRLLALSTRRKADLAARKLELADRIRRLIAIRERRGLERSEAVITAESEVSQARAEFHQAESDRKTAWTHLVIASGLSGAAADIRQSLFREPQSGKLKNIETEGLR